MGRKAVLYPAKFVEMTKEFKSDTRVLNFAAFLSWFEKEPPAMPAEDVNLIANRLKILSGVPTPEIATNSKRRAS